MAVTRSSAIDLHGNDIADFCQRFNVRQLALFGSVLTADFSSDSDVDVLVTFEPETQVGLLMLSRMQRELSVILGQQVDLVPKEALKSILRDEVLRSAQVIYEA